LGVEDDAFTELTNYSPVADRQSQWVNADLGLSSHRFFSEGAGVSEVDLLELPHRT